MARKRSRRTRKEIEDDIKVESQRVADQGLVHQTIYTGMFKTVVYSPSEKMTALDDELRSLGPKSFNEFASDVHEQLVRDIKACPGADGWDGSGKFPLRSMCNWQANLEDAWYHLKELKVAVANNETTRIVEQAYSLGMSQSQYSLRRDFELDVLKRKKQQKGLSEGRRTKTSAKNTKASLAVAEIKKRMQGHVTMTQIVEQMDKELAPNGKKLWGCRSTLMGYCKSHGLNSK